MTRTNPAQNVSFGNRHPAELPHPNCAPIGGYARGYYEYFA